MDMIEHREWLEDTDQGATTVSLDDPPDWMTPGELAVDCPICGVEVADHDSVRVADASGEIFECLLDGGDWQRADDGRPSYDWM